MLAVMSYPPLSEPEQQSYPAGEFPHGDNLSHPMYYNASNMPYQNAYEPTYAVPVQEHANYMLANSSNTTPIPTSSSVNSSPWLHYNTSSVSDHPYGYASLPPAMRPVLSQMEDEASSMLGGPMRRSPSAFDPTPDVHSWPGQPIGLGMRYPGHDQATNTASSSMDNEFYPAQSPSSLEHPRPRKNYPTLAPNNGQSPKRNRDDEDKESVCSTDKRRKLTGSISSSELAEEDRLLVQLKEEEDLPWKGIAARFTAHYNKTFQVAALQMRYKRLREKHRAWTNDEVEALRLAHEHWEKAKWDIISAKMVELGVQERWAAKQCAKKWHALHEPATGATDPMSTAQPLFPTPPRMSDASSQRGEMHFIPMR